jgi:uncharacterized protein (TIGR03437 family)
MSRKRLVLVVLLLKIAWAQAPAYTANEIVNASDYAPGPFAPNSVLSIFGTNLSWYTAGVTPDAVKAAVLPSTLGGAEVYVDNWAAPLLYVSPSQINFIVPDNEISGPITVSVVRQGVVGPTVTVTLVEAAPALFGTGTGYAIATHADGALLTADSPAQGGETIVLYATGLGPTQPNPDPGAIPPRAATMLYLSSLSVSLDGVALPSFRIKYAGLTPLSAGLYQINIELPPDVGTDPAIQVTVGTQSDSDGLKIAVQ